MLIATPLYAQEPKKKASEHFDKGIMLFKNEDYSAALIEFEAAYQAQPHFKVRYNIAICMYKLHEYGDAANQIQHYLAEGGDEVPLEKRIEVEKILEELQSLVGSITVICNVEGAELYVDSKRRDKLPMFFPLSLDVGEYEVEVRAEGYRPFKTKVKLPGGESRTIEAELVPVKGRAHKRKAGKKRVPLPAFVSMAGLTGTLALTAGITGGIALKKAKDSVGTMTGTPTGRSISGKLTRREAG